MAVQISALFGVFRYGSASTAAMSGMMETSITADVAVLIESQTPRFVIRRTDNLTKRICPNTVKMMKNQKLKLCEQCHNTGWAGDNGPGIRGNREYAPCECRNKQMNEVTDQVDCSSSFSTSWISTTTKPTGQERKVLVWVVWPQCGWPQWPEPKIGWWKHGPGCFAIDNVENADHLVTHWMDISDPNAKVTAPKDSPTDLFDIFFMKTDTPITDSKATFRADDYDDGITQWVQADFARCLEKDAADLYKLARAFVGNTHPVMAAHVRLFNLSNDAFTDPDKTSQAK